MFRQLTAFLATLSLAGLTAPGTTLAADSAAGQVIFNANCSSCHGLSGKGDGTVGGALNPPPRDFTVADFDYNTDGDCKKGEDADLDSVIKNGAMKYGGSPLMAPWPTLSDAQVADVIAYIRSLETD